MSYKILFLMLLAGALGTLARYGGLKLMEILCPDASWPWGTFSVNLTGAFLAGLVFTLATGRFPSWIPYLPVLLIGFMGAFTTFSTFALECARMLHAREYLRAAGYLGLQNGLGIASAYGGFLFGKLFC